MALTKLNQLSDGLTDLQVKLEPLQAIGIIRRHCPKVLDTSEVCEYEYNSWEEVTQLITELKTITNKKS